ncbi:MAG: choice-of-anchor Q domain-containing protein [Rudaea sp.]
MTVDGANNSAMIYHLGVGTLRISGISITNGRKYFNDSDTSGACVHTIGDLQLDHVKVSHCSTSAGAYRTVKGGAVFVGGYASVLHSTISDSSALSISTAGGRKALGGGIYSGGGLYMIGSTISNNVASTNPRAYSYGGGVAAKGKVTIVESLISKNQAYSGGGVYLADLHNTPAVIDNSTISGNNAYIVGGVFARPEVDLYNSTIAFNTSSKWSGTRGEYAAGLYVSRLAIMQSTIIARNVNTGVDLPSADVTGASSAILLGDNNNVMFCAIVCPLRTTSEDPGLGPLLDNGGPTRTHRPTPGLWNRFGGNNIHGAQFDQRGVGFPRESSPDRIEIGAFQTNSGILFVNGFN